MTFNSAEERNMRANRSFYHNLRRALRWIEDIQSGEMIETWRYERGCLGFYSISRIELRRICNILNMILEGDTTSQLRVVETVGEIRPIRKV